METEGKKKFSEKIKKILPSKETMKKVGIVVLNVGSYLGAAAIGYFIGTHSMNDSDVEVFSEEASTDAIETVIE